MHKFLSAFLGILAFLIVCLYWLWQMLAGGPALPWEDVALRAVAAMLVIWLLGRLLGRLGSTVISEAWHEAQARGMDRSGKRIVFGGGSAPPGTKAPGGKRTG